jgi:hypothetical protein
MSHLKYIFGLILIFDLCGKNVQHGFGSFARSRRDLDDLFLTTSEIFRILKFFRDPNDTS